MTTPDKIETIGKGSLIHHGKQNNRVYLMKMHPADFPSIINDINLLAKENKYTKLFCKVPSWAAPVFIANGFITEAQIPRFYNGKHDVFFMAKYLSSDRLLDLETDKLEGMTELLKADAKAKLDIPDGINLRPLNKDDAKAITEVYKQVFDTYPFPIFEEWYIIETINDNVQYFGAENNEGNLIAISSAEIDKKGQNVEMTDFATLPESRGKSIATLLLHEMEKAMKAQKIGTLYTIARLNSPAMNRTFLKMGYRYSGTLIKNTNIAGKIESMNVLYKHLEM